MPNTDEQIRRAMEEGQFEDLPGKGRPLKLEEDPLEDPEWRMAHHMLRSSGYSLPWIEVRREIESGLESARQDLARAWERRQTSQLTPNSLSRWEAAQASFCEAVAELNKRILSYNLEAPSMQLHLRAMDAEAEIKKITLLK
jgi:DnaJ homolog subfamily C member 28